MSVTNTTTKKRKKKKFKKLKKKMKKKKTLDLAFLYADPIVKIGQNGSVQAVEAPLNLEGEYSRVIDSLKTTGKEFTVKKEAINF